MFIVFEGIDGSGKTTISNQVVARLQAQGRRVKHLRAGGQFASAVTEAIRTLGRDARNLDLDPKAEFLLYVTREVQLVEEVLKPALVDHDIVVADRYFPTAEVLGRYARHLPRDFVDAVLKATASELKPDIVVLIDVDPALARARRRAAKIAAADTRPPARRGLAGVGLQHRLRAGYCALAERNPDSWFTLRNHADLDGSVREVNELISRALHTDVSAALAHARRARTPLPDAFGNQVRSLGDALQKFVRWLERRAEREPRVAAYMLSGLWGAPIDALREALATRVPDAVLASAASLQDEVSWQIRERLRATHPAAVADSMACLSNRDERSAALRALLLRNAPREVLGSLALQDDEQAWSMRAYGFDAYPHAVMRSLRGLGSEVAWHLRERWLHDNSLALATEYEVARSAAASVSGSSDERAWRLRSAAWQAAPAAALSSLIGLNCGRSWRRRERHLRQAPKVVMGTLRGMRDHRAWDLRREVAADCKEALDSIWGLDDQEAWELRERYADIWASTAVKSLGPLADTERGRTFVESQLRAHPDNLSLLKHASAIALGVHRNAVAAG